MRKIALAMMILFFFVSSNGYADEAINETFESLSIGLIDGQENWTSPPIPGWPDSIAEVVSSPTHSGSRALHLSRFISTATYTINSPAATNTIISFWYREQYGFGTNDTGNNMSLRNAITLSDGYNQHTTYVNICHAGSGHRSVLMTDNAIGNGSCVNGVGDMTEGNWYFIEVEYDFGNRTAHARVDGGDWGSNINLRVYGGANGSYITSFSPMSVWDNPPQFWFDDFGQVTPPQACTYTYSDWGDCQPDSTQTRTLLTATPDGCTGTPVLSQSCTPLGNLEISPTSHDFGIVIPGQCSASQEFTVTNTGAGTLHVSDMSVPDSGDFTLILSGGSNPCNSVNPSLPPGASCTLTTAYCPSAVGSANTYIYITSDDPVNPTMSILFTGTASNVIGWVVTIDGMNMWSTFLSPWADSSTNYLNGSISNATKPTRAKIEENKGKIVGFPWNGDTLYTHFYVENLYDYLKYLVALSSGDLTKALHFIPSMHQSRYSNRPVEP